LDLTSELCQTVGDELFFTWHIFLLEVGKTQDLSSKIWQTLGDAFKGGLFFTCHIFLEVGKTQDLLSKIWQTVGDALRCKKCQVICQTIGGVLSVFLLK
jgi:hypothetical protein